MIRVLGVFLLLFLSVGCHHTTTPEQGKEQKFELYETSIAEFHKALAEGRTTCQEVVQQYIDRINTYDGDSTNVGLNSIITLNPDALFIAEELDKNFTVQQLKKYPLYGVPVVIKDNINTKDMATSGGAIAFQNNRPAEDAFVIKKLREAGAIILAKANLSEFAFDYKGKSSLGGTAKNVYDQTKGAGGSSSGTAVAVAANLAMVGLGTDTGGSIRIPAALAGLTGLRPSMNLISQNGVMPLSPWQDVVGPMCRNVEDCARILDVMAAYDPDISGNQKIKYHMNARHINNVKEYAALTRKPEKYSELLDASTLKGLRIGVVRALFGKDSVATHIVNPVIDRAIDSMRSAGAIVRDVKIRELDSILKNYISMSGYEFKSSLEKYLNSWSVLEDQHLLSYDELMTSGGFLEESKKGLEYRNSIDIHNLTEKQAALYKKNTRERPVFVRSRLLEALDNVESSDQPFDILLYPTVTGVAAELEKGTNAGDNNRLSPFSGFPALTMTAGMVENDGITVPVGVELLGRDFDELLLLNIAYAYEQHFHLRVPPQTAPDL